MVDIDNLRDEETGGAEEEEPEEPDEKTEVEADEEDAISIATDEAGTPVILTYTVDENVPLREVTFEGNTVLDEETLSDIFRPVERGGGVRHPGIRGGGGRGERELQRLRLSR